MFQRQLFKKTTFIEEQPTINNMFRTGIAQVPHLHSLSAFFCSHVMDLSCAHFLQVGVDDVLIYWFIFPWSKKWKAWRNLKLQTHRAIDEKNMIFYDFFVYKRWLLMMNDLCALQSVFHLKQTWHRCKLWKTPGKKAARICRYCAATTPGPGGFWVGKFLPAQGLIHAGHEWPLCSAVCFPPQAHL